MNPMPEPLSREQVGQMEEDFPPTRGSTHYEGCERTHMRCALWMLMGSHEAQRATIAAMTQERDRLREAVIQCDHDIAAKYRAALRGEGG